MESKKDIRNRVLEKRTNLTENEWVDKSEWIYKKVISHPMFTMAQEIYCYIDFRKEVGTKKIIETAWQMEKKVACPKVLGDDMEFYYVKGFEDFTPGSWGILEPFNQDLACGSNVLVIMPGAAFNQERHRIGYGRGYYDRYLDRHPDYQTMALAFELQMVENIPVDTHDISPQIVVTEEKIYV